MNINSIIPFFKNSTLNNFLSNLRYHRSIVAVIDQGFVSATNFITGVIVGRVCSKEEFGIYMLGLTVLFVAVEIQSSIITTPYMTFYPKVDKTNRRIFNGSSLVHQIIFSLLLGIIFLVVGYTLSYTNIAGNLSKVFLLLSVFGIFIVFRDYLRRILFARLELFKVLVFDISISFLQLSSLLILAYVGLLNSATTFLLIGLVSGIIVLMLLLRNKDEFEISEENVVDEAQRNWSFGKWVLISGIVWTSSMNLYPWFITFSHGTEATGVWAACLGIMSIGNPIRLGIQNHLGPQIATEYVRKTIEKFKSYLLKGILKFIGALIPVLLILIFFGGLLLTLIYGDKYSGNGSIVSLLGINLIFSAINFPLSRTFFAMERADLDFKVNLSALAVLLTLGIWLVYSFGPIGAAIGLIIANFISIIVRFIVLYKSI